MTTRSIELDVHAALAALGVSGSGGLLFESVATPVVLLSDVSGVVKPPPLQVVGTSGLAAAILAQFGAIQIRPISRDIEILWFKATSDVAVKFTFGVRPYAALTTLATSNAPGWSTLPMVGDRSTQVEAGGIFPPIIFFPFAAADQIVEPRVPIRVDEGNAFIVMTYGINQDIDLSIMWRELPQ